MGRPSKPIKDLEHSTLVKMVYSLRNQIEEVTNERDVLQGVVARMENERQSMVEDLEAKDRMIETLHEQIEELLSLVNFFHPGFY